MKGELHIPRKVPFRMLPSGHKKFYNVDTTFNNLQTRMVVTGITDEIY